MKDVPTSNWNDFSYGLAFKDSKGIEKDQAKLAF
jgi:hypothetical protein